MYERSWWQNMKRKSNKTEYSDEEIEELIKATALAERRKIKKAITKFNSATMDEYWAGCLKCCKCGDNPRIYFTPKRSKKTYCFDCWSIECFEKWIIKEEAGGSNG